MPGLFEKLTGGLFSNKAEAPTTPKEQVTLQATQKENPFTSRLKALFSGSEELDSYFYDELEETLLLADTGLDTADKLINAIKQSKPKAKSDALNALKHKCEVLLNQPYNLQHVSPHINLPKQPQSQSSIILVVGVNGAGKTTFIGKLAKQCRQQGLNVVIGAGDTFRAAAEDQLAVWAQRADVPLIQINKGDPAAVMHDTLAYAKTHGSDVIILDTAGRLQNQQNLMAELAKINGVIDRQQPDNAVRETLLVLDATTGQNGLKQAEIFNQSVKLTGVVLTKLDGSAKGGIALAIVDTFKLPIKAVGVGEGIDDLIPFDPKAYIDQLILTPDSTQVI